VKKEVYALPRNLSLFKRGLPLPYQVAGRAPGRTYFPYWYGFRSGVRDTFALERDSRGEASWKLAGLQFPKLASMGNRYKLGTLHEEGGTWREHICMGATPSRDQNKNLLPLLERHSRRGKTGGKIRKLKKKKSVTAEGKGAEKTTRTRSGIGRELKIPSRSTLLMVTQGKE